MKSLIGLSLAGLLAASITTSAGAVDQRGRATSPQPSARAEMKDTNGRTIGTFELRQTGAAMIAVVDVNGLPAGRYGVHIHMVGRCDAPDFTSAGGHWNPTGAQHGIDAQRGPHSGDLPNLAVNANGRGYVMQTLDGGARLRGGAGALLDADGAAIMIHAGEDDYRTDPSGNSGARIACGVIHAAR